MTAQTIQQLRNKIRSGWLNTATIDQLLCHTLDCSRTELYAYPEQNLNSMQAAQFAEYISQYRTGKPLAQIVGHCEFFSLPFEVSPQVLIPRPETELLVVTVLQHLKSKADVLELGVGCGVIAVALAKNYPQIGSITATDIHHEALQVAQRNAHLNKAQQIHFLRGDWLTAINKQRKFNIIVSNPPYVAINDCHFDPAVAAYEPALALFAGKDGLDHLQTIIAQAPLHLKEEGMLLVEHGALHEKAVANLMTQAGLSQICCYKDLAQLPRITVGRK